MSDEININAVLSRAESSHKEILAAYDAWREQGHRFEKVLGAEATGHEVVGTLRKYWPQIATAVGSAGGGAGLLAVLGNVFPGLAQALGLGG